jgi:hypothetical protein
MAVKAFQRILDHFRGRGILALNPRERRQGTAFIAERRPLRSPLDRVGLEATMLFPAHILRLFVLAERDKTAVPKVVVIRPLDELKLAPRVRE